MKYITKVAIPFGRMTVPKDTPLDKDKDGDYCCYDNDDILMGWWTKEVIEANPFMFEAVPEPQPPRWTDDDMAVFGYLVVNCTGTRTISECFEMFKKERGIK